MHAVQLAVGGGQQEEQQGDGCGSKQGCTGVEVEALLRRQALHCSEGPAHVFCDASCARRVSRCTMHQERNAHLPR